MLFGLVIRTENQWITGQIAKNPQSLIAQPKDIGHERAKQPEI